MRCIFGITHRGLPAMQSLQCDHAGIYSFCIHQRLMIAVFDDAATVDHSEKRNASWAAMPMQDRCRPRGIRMISFFMIAVVFTMVA
jgi:hypothetical protein